MQNEFEKLAEKYLLLKKKNTTLEAQVGKLSSPEILVCDECLDLKKKNLQLTKALEKFTKGSEMLKVILKDQRFTNDKFGVGYNLNLDKNEGKKKKRW